MDLRKEVRGVGREVTPVASSIIKGNKQAIYAGTPASIDALIAPLFNIYYSERWSDAPDENNTNGTVMVIPRSGNNLTQMYFPTNVAAFPTVFVRSRFSSGSFSAWMKLNVTS